MHVSLRVCQGRGAPPTPPGTAWQASRHAPACRQQQQQRCRGSSRAAVGYTSTHTGHTAGDAAPCQQLHSSSKGVWIQDTVAAPTTNHQPQRAPHPCLNDSSRTQFCTVSVLYCASLGLCLPSTRRASPVCRDNACCPVSKDDLLAAVREVPLHLAGGVVEYIQAVRVCALPHSHLHT